MQTGQHRTNFNFIDDVKHLGFPRTGRLRRMLRNFADQLLGLTVNPRKLETRLRTMSAKIPDTLLLRIKAIGFPTSGLLLYINYYGLR